MTVSSVNNNERFKTVGKTSDGRVIVEVKDWTSDKYAKSTLPEENVDKFEKMTNELHAKYSKYTDNHYKKLYQLVYFNAILSTTAGAALTAAFTKSKSGFGRFFKTTAGALGGFLAGCLVLTGVIGAKAIGIGKEVKKLGLKPYKDEEINQEKMTKEEAKEGKNEKKQLETQS